MITTAYANGFPKSGNNALVRALELLGLPVSVNHTPYGFPVGENHIFIKRDPRNVVVSWLRHQGKPVAPGTFLAAFRKFANGSLVDEMARFEGWLDDAATYVVRFEDLLRDSEAMETIAQYFEIPYHARAFEQLRSPTPTYNEVPSNYKDVWTIDVQSAFENEGGNELLTRWGY